MENNAKGPKLGLVLGHFSGKRWEVQKNQNWVFMTISDDSKPIYWEKNEEKNGKFKIGNFPSFWTDLKKYKMIKIGCSELFWTTLVGQDWEKCKIGHSKSFWTTLVRKDGGKCRITKIGCFEEKIGKGVK